MTTPYTWQFRDSLLGSNQALMGIIQSRPITTPDDILRLRDLASLMYCPTMPAHQTSDPRLIYPIVSAVWFNHTQITPLPTHLTTPRVPTGDDLVIICPDNSVIHYTRAALGPLLHVYDFNRSGVVIGDNLVLQLQDLWDAFVSYGNVFWVDRDRLRMASAREVRRRYSPPIPLTLDENAIHAFFQSTTPRYAACRNLLNRNGAIVSTQELTQFVREGGDPHLQRSYVNTGLYVLRAICRMYRIDSLRALWHLRNIVEVGQCIGQPIDVHLQYAPGVHAIFANDFPTDLARVLPPLPTNLTINEDTFVIEDQAPTTRSNIMGQLARDTPTIMGYPHAIILRAFLTFGYRFVDIDGTLTMVQSTRRTVPVDDLTLPRPTADAVRTRRRSPQRVWDVDPAPAAAADDMPHFLSRLRDWSSSLSDRVRDEQDEDWAFERSRRRREAEAARDRNIPPAGRDRAITSAGRSRDADLARDRYVPPVGRDRAITPAGRSRDADLARDRYVPSAGRSREAAYSSRDFTPAGPAAGRAHYIPPTDFDNLILPGHLGDDAYARWARENSRDLRPAERLHLMNELAQRVQVDRRPFAQPDHPRDAEFARQFPIRDRYAVPDVRPGESAAERIRRLQGMTDQRARLDDGPVVPPAPIRDADGARRSLPVPARRNRVDDDFEPSRLASIIAPASPTQMAAATQAIAALTAAITAEAENLPVEQAITAVEATPDNMVVQLTRVALRDTVWSVTEIPIFRILAERSEAAARLIRTWCQEHPAESIVQALFLSRLVALLTDQRIECRLVAPNNARYQIRHAYAIIASRTTSVQFANAIPKFQRPFTLTTKECYNVVEQETCPIKDLSVDPDQVYFYITPANVECQSKTTLARRIDASLNDPTDYIGVSQLNINVHHLIEAIISPRQIFYTHQVAPNETDLAC